ncbi:hypothetical protein CUMW_264400 [Citrus unshiu]|uniref:Uncharacterized protein n=1 Tax=Citrus unshiu TaxID=55188 RepID=A0A2H5QV24_CITUN|nr:hypothetical protein CUMW_264400 [Citrus unshiu]
MGITFRLFSERLRRVLASQEVTLPDAAKEPIQNLHAEVEIVTPWLRDYEYDMSWLLLQKIGEDEVDNPDLGRKSIALPMNLKRINDIKQRMQQLQYIDSGIIDDFKNIEDEAGYFPASLSSKNSGMVGLEDRMEKLLDILKEGPPQLSVVAFAAEAYSSSDVKHYFNCHAWVPEPYNYDADDDQILDMIMKFLMPSSRLSIIKDKNYEMKKKIQQYLMIKRYLIVVDDVWRIEVWDVIREIVPDNQNGCGVLITLIEIDIVISFHISLKENIEEALDEPLGLQVVAYCMLPFYLKLCCLYLSVFPVHFEISTKQLYQSWIAEGFITDNNEATAEKYLEQLINGGFVILIEEAKGLVFIYKHLTMHEQEF